MLKEIKYFIQRGKRGYSDRDLWDFDSYLSEILPPALRKLSKQAYGCPGELWDKDAVNTECHKWAEILEEMAQGFEVATAIKNMQFFESVKSGSGYTREINREKQKLLTEKFEKGMGLFAKYYLDLWD